MPKQKPLTDEPAVDERQNDESAHKPASELTELTDPATTTDATPKPFGVLLQGQHFALRKLDELNPGQVIILRLLMPQRNLPLVIEDENDVRVAKLVQSIDKCLAIIAPELAQQNLPFIKKLDVLDYYERNSPGLIRQSASQGKGKGKGKRTGPVSVQP